MYEKERKLTINFKNGLSKTITPLKGGESFLDFTQDERDKISSLRIVLGDQTFTISKKINDQLEATGFFYHIMEGRRTILGQTSGRDNPLISERIGFCYNNSGFANAILIDYIKGNVEFVKENILQLGVNIALFHDMMEYKEPFEKELEIFRKEYIKSMKKYIENMKSNNPLDLDVPEIPFLPANGIPPRILFNSKDVTEYKPRH